MKGIFSKILLSVFSVGLVAGTFMLDSSQSQAAAANSQERPEFEIVSKGQDAVVQKNEQGYIIKSGDASPMSVVLQSNVVIRLAAESEVQIQISQIPERVIIITLKNGRLWVNSQNSISQINIKTEGTEAVSLTGGVFDAKYANRILNLGSHRRSLAIKFLNSSLVLPEGRSIAISDAKIAASGETLKKLRYSKLAKEFPFYELETPDEWVLANRADDEKFFSNYEKKIFDEIRSRGPKLGDENSFLFKTGKILNRADVFLTFDPQKKHAKELERARDYFDSGLYATLIGQKDNAQSWFDQFKTFVLSLSDSPEKDRMILDALNRIAFAPTDSPFFAAKKTLRENIRSAKILEIQQAFDDVLDVAASGVHAETELRTLAELRKYGVLLSGALPGVSKKSADWLFLESVRFNDFLFRRRSLFRDEFLRIAEMFEKWTIELIADNEAALDSRQYFIGEKLKKIGVIKKLIDENGIPLEDARKSILSLVSQVDKLKPEIAEAAVLDYFDAQLKTYGPLIAFLRATPPASLRGSFQENFTQFTERMSEVKLVTDLLEKADGGAKISANRREELAGIVAEDFGEPGISDIRIMLPEAENDTRVRIVQAFFEGKKFTGLYDTSRKIFSDLVIDGQKIQSAVRLENFQSFFLARMGKLALPKGVSVESFTEQPSSQSVLEKVAKTTLLTELDKLKISVEEKYLGMDDLARGIVHVRLALLGKGSESIVFAFDVSQRFSVVNKLKVQTVAGEIEVDEEFSLRELPVKVAQIYELASFEQQKEEELERFAEESEISELPVIDEEEFAEEEIVPEENEEELTE